MLQTFSAAFPDPEKKGCKAYFSIEVATSYAVFVRADDDEAPRAVWRRTRPRASAQDPDAGAADPHAHALAAEEASRGQFWGMFRVLSGA